MTPATVCRSAIAASDIDPMACAVARLDVAAMEAFVAAHVAVAVREHRIDDAVRWQRVRLRARNLRAAAATTACRA